MLEKREAECLGRYASLSAETKGRAKQSTPCDIRTEFQRDRDKIIHSKAFRRLKHKTQVFFVPENDHYRTRLTHTLEVSQIARTISRALRLNEDLTEAIALGHDLGHTPFGHSGERALDSLCPMGFLHNEQSLRVVDVLENNGRGMNLTFEVRDGIANHTGDTSPKTLEGQVVRLADKIAYINHDIDDSIRAGVISADDIPLEFVRHYGDRRADRIDAMIRSVVKNSFDKDRVRMADEDYEMLMKLRQFMFENVYFAPAVKAEEKKIKHMIPELYEFLIKNPDKLPKEYCDENPHQNVCDYIASMTDSYCIEKHREYVLGE